MLSRRGDSGLRSRSEVLRQTLQISLRSASRLLALLQELAAAVGDEEYAKQLIAEPDPHDHVESDEALARALAQMDVSWADYTSRSASSQWILLLTMSRWTDRVRCGVQSSSTSDHGSCTRSILQLRDMLPHHHQHQLLRCAHRVQEHNRTSAQQPDETSAFAGPFYKLFPAIPTSKCDTSPAGACLQFAFIVGRLAAGKTSAGQVCGRSHQFIIAISTTHSARACRPRKHICSTSLLAAVSFARQVN